MVSCRPPNPVRKPRSAQIQARYSPLEKTPHKAPFHHIVLMMLYAPGVRRAELTRLKITDIDNRRMIIHIQGGKGRKDRDVMLSPKLLEALRAYQRHGF